MRSERTSKFWAPLLVTFCVPSTHECAQVTKGPSAPSGSPLQLHVPHSQNCYVAFHPEGGSGMAFRPRQSEGRFTSGWERCQWVFFLLSCAWGMCRATGLCFQGLAALRPNRHSLHWGKSCKSKNCFEIKNLWKLYYHKGDGLSSYLPVHLQPVEFKVTWDKCVCSTESTLIYPPWTTSQCAIHLWKSSDLPSTKVIL